MPGPRSLVLVSNSLAELARAPVGPKTMPCDRGAAMDEGKAKGFGKD
jgi:hypothetical protein